MSCRGREVIETLSVDATSSRASGGGAMVPQPASADEALLRAATLRAAGRLAEATTVLSEALRRHHRAHGVSYQLALLEAERGNWSEAEHLARTAATLGGEGYASGLGQILAKAGKYEEAREWLLRALALNANDAEALVCLGAVYGEQRKLDEALTYINQALLIRPDFPEAQFCRERMLAEQSFLRGVRAAYAEFAGRTGLNSDLGAAGQAEIEFPSAFLDANGNPRFKMWIPASLVLSDLGAAHLFYHEVAERGYEFLLRRFLDLQLSSDDVFIDVGAHWGVHSLTAATLWPNQVSVLAIEPHPENSTRLRSWVERNRLGADVEVIPNAIGDREGVAQMRVDGSSMGHSLRAHNGRSGVTTTIDVLMTTLDQLLIKRAHLRWRRIIIKIDVEGYEWEVLSGARQLLASGSVAAVIWENGAFYGRTVREQRTKAIVGCLRAYGFEHFRMQHEDPGARLVPLQDNDLPGDVFSLAPNLDRRERYA
jgi:FkbM family methyltransferase